MYDDFLIIASIISSGLPPSFSFTSLGCTLGMSLMRTTYSPLSNVALVDALAKDSSSTDIVSKEFSSTR